MAISKLVTGTPFDRPAITFSTKSADSNMQKASSSLLTNKSSMGDLADSMSRLNIQLTQLQKVSNEIMKSIASVLKTIARVDHDMTGRFRTLNKELAASRTEFTRSLANITPSLTGGAGATISAAALGTAASVAEAAIPSSGNSKWDAFMAFVRYAAPTLFKRIGGKLLLMSALAAAPVLGWVLDAIVFVTVIADAIELYNLWCQFSNQQPQQAAIDAALATQNNPQTPAAPPGSPQGATTSAATQMSMMEPQDKAGAPQGGASATTSAATQMSMMEPQDKAGATPPAASAAAAPTDMSIGGETGAFGASAQAATAPQPMRRPAETAPAATTGAPIMTPPDPHAKSKAMFQQQQDMERNGDSGATAMFFAADQQRQKELAGLKAVATAPGAPVEAKKAAAKSIQDATNPATFGRGGGHTTGETAGAIGRGGGDHTDPRKLGRGAGSHTLPTDGLPGGDTGLSDRDVRSANMQNASNMMEAKYKNEDAMGATHAKGITAIVDSNAARDAMLNMQGIDDKDRANDVRYKPKEEQRAAQNAKMAAGATPAAAGMRAGPKAFGAAIGGGPEANAENPPAVPGAGAPTAKPAATAPTKIEPEGDESAGYKGKLGQILQTNMNDYNVVNKSAGGDQNVTPNLPLSADNPLLTSKFRKQYLQNHQ